MINNDKIVGICMFNSYNLITGKKTLNEILEESKHPYFLWNIIHSDIDDEVFDTFIDLMIGHYEYSEEYEKCSELLNIKNYEKDKRDKYKRKITKTDKVR
tara:strand:+ start:1171 stop:1470 length:300 start_codon:yes stop_codon:yes gene_type:complete